MSFFVLDTNVLIAANGRDTHADPACRLAAIQKLRAIQTSDAVSLDEIGFIMAEYRTYCYHAGAPGVGDAFYRWLHDHQYNSAKCERVPVTPDGAGSFTEFPSDPDFAGFNLSDHVFVVVALKSAHKPPIVNAMDSDWLHFGVPLNKAGIVIDEICPHLLK